jgi:hypothetical protein
MDGGGNFFAATKAGITYLSVDRVDGTGATAHISTANFTIMAIVCRLNSGQPLATATTICATTFSAYQRQFIVQAGVTYFFRLGLVNAPPNANYLLTVAFPP